MDFFIKINRARLKHQSLREIQSSQEPAFKLIDRKTAFKTNKYILPYCEIYIVGDVIFPQDISSSHEMQAAFIIQHIKQNELFQLKGFFYVILLNYENNSINIYSCFLNILPVYYHVSDDVFTVSGSLFEIVENLERKPEPNETYLVEKALFNYSFLNRTPFSDIFLMPSCNFINISKDGLKTNKSYSLEDFIVENPKPWNKNLSWLSEIYCKELIAYLPEKPFAMTLTGGFDGRTVLSAALRKKAEFNAFSYGSINDPDIILPEYISKSIGFPYKSFILDDTYAKNNFWNDAINFLLKSEGSGNLSRGQYVYTANELSKSYDYLLTGNFGSELIRSMKDPGVMASKTLFALFEYENKSEFDHFVHNIKNIDFISPELKNKYLRTVLDEVWEYKQSLPKSYTVNQKFYMYMFGEVFRKYFGPEIVMQSNFIINRSPFIDFNIFKSTLETSIAGLYQNFREKSPVKRFHGQILYAHILRLLYPPLLDFMLDKGYKPKDFLSTTGRLSIFLGYQKRKFFERNTDLKPSYSEKYYVLNNDKINSIIEKSSYLDWDLIKEYLQTGEWKKHQHEFVNALSMELFFQKYLN